MSTMTPRNFGFVFLLLLPLFGSACKKGSKAGFPPRAAGPLPVRMVEFTTEFERIPPNLAYIRKHRIKEVVAVTRLTKHGLRERKRERWQYDGDGRLTSYVEIYDGKVRRRVTYEYVKGRLVREVLEDLGWKTRTVVEVAHDAAGRLRRKSGAGEVVRYHYDAAGLLLREHRRERKGKGAMTMSYTYQGRRIATVKLTRGADRLVLEQRRGYDAHGREVSRHIRKPGMKLAPVKILTSYNAQGLLGRIDVREAGDKLLHRRFFYAKGRLVKELVTSHVSAVGDDTIEYTYTLHGPGERR